MLCSRQNAFVERTKNTKCLLFPPLLSLGNHHFLALSLMETSPSFTSPAYVKFLLVVMTLQNWAQHSLAFNAAPLASQVLEVQVAKIQKSHYSLVCIEFLSESLNSPRPTAQPRNPTAHQANGQPGTLLLRPMGISLAQWVRSWVSFYAHGYPVGQPSNPIRCPARQPSPIIHNS